MYMKKNNIWFTLVELIVVITILAILWTVWFIAFLWYIKTSRDVVRLSDIDTIKKSLWIYVTQNSKYPLPTDYETITHSWANIWFQWIFWKRTFTNVRIINKVPSDPLSSNEYTYSVSNNKLEYEISWIIEWEWFQWFNNYINDVYASWNRYVTAYVDGTYNWIVSRMSTWGTDYILALPSITSSDLSWTDLNFIVWWNKLVYNWYWNLPYSYKSAIFNRDWIFSFSPNPLVVFVWFLSDLHDLNNQIILLNNLQKSYSWVVIDDNNSIINAVLEMDIDLIKPSSKVKVFACSFINFSLKYYVECWWLDFITFFVTNILHFDISNLPWSQINFAFQDALNWDFWFWTNDWIATYSDWNWTIYQKDPNDSNSLVHNNVTSITRDNLWNYWFWTVNWISMFDWDNTWVTYSNNTLVSSHVQYIYTASDWTVWIWTNGWISSYNSSVWEDYLKKNDWLSANNITTIFEDSDSHVWFWTNSKWVDKYVIVDWEWTVTNYTTPNLPNKVITYIFQDSFGNMWIWTDWWLAKYVSGGMTWEQYTVANTWWDLPDDKITYIYEDSNNNLWFWTQLAWVVRVSSDLLTWTKYDLSNSPIPLSWNEIKSIFQDDNWNILIISDWWINTIDSGGVLID